jgi:hypothetical protein
MRIELSTLLREGASLPLLLRFNEALLLSRMTTTRHVLKGKDPPCA